MQINSKNSQSCPKCKVKLNKKDFEGHVIGICPECKGALINQKEITDILNKLYIRLMDEFKIPLKLSPIPDKLIRIQCPNCHKPMDQHGYLQSKHVIIDICLDCKLIFLDRHECVMMALLYSDYTENVKREDYIRTSQPNNSSMRAVLNFIW